MRSKASPTILSRFRTGLLLGLALAAGIYLAYTLAIGWNEVAAALGRFAWEWLPVLLALSLVNYALRFLRWEYYLRLLGIRVSWRTSVAIFLSGLAMTITPGKVGEFLKSYLLKESDGVPMATSAPVVFAERVGDLLALLLLASLGVSSFGGPRALPILIGSGVVIGVALVVLQSRPLTGLSLRLLVRLPFGERIAPKVGEMLDSSRALLGLRALVPGLLLATVSWYCECLEYFFAFRGFGVEGVGLDLSVFAYAFSTVLGVVSPGGIGPTDIGLIEIARQFVDNLSHEVATAASFIVRFCTLWFAVGLGAAALFRFGSVLQVSVDEAKSGGESRPEDNGA